MMLGKQISLKDMESVVRYALVHVYAFSTCILLLWLCRPLGKYSSSHNKAVIVYLDFRALRVLEPSCSSSHIKEHRWYRTTFCVNCHMVCLSEPGITTLPKTYCIFKSWDLPQHSPVTYYLETEQVVKEKSCCFCVFTLVNLCIYSR